MKRDGKNFFLILFYALILTTYSFGNDYQGIRYDLSLENIEKLTVSVKIRITGKLEKSLSIDLPNNWAGIDYTAQIKNIKIKPFFKFRIVKNQAHQVVIEIPDPINEISITYDVHQKDGDPSNIHETIIRKDIVHGTGYGLLGLPADINWAQPLNFSLSWKDLPTAWNVLSSFNNEKMVNKRFNPAYILHAFFLTGKTRLYNLENLSGTVFLSLYSQFNIKEDEIVSDIKDIIQTQRSSFNDFDFPYYAISLVEGDNPHSSGGTRLQNSFTAYFQKNIIRLDYYKLIAHEHLHNWLGGKIQDNSDGVDCWWKEGFTDYYALIFTFRSKIISVGEFVKETNLVLRN